MTPPPELPELRAAWGILREIARAVRADWEADPADTAGVEITACQNSNVPFGVVLGEVAKQCRISGPLDLRHLLPRRAEDHGTAGPPTNPEYLAKKAELTTKGTVT